MPLQYLTDLWDESHARTLDPPALLRYRSNLLGSDLRITNFGGGNTSSKLAETDPLDGQPASALGQGQRRRPGQHQVAGFATLFWIRCLRWPGFTWRRWKTRWSACIRCAPSATIPLLPRSIRRCTLFFPFRMSTIFIRTGESRSLLRPTARKRWMSSTAVRSQAGVDSLAASGL